MSRFLSPEEVRALLQAPLGAGETDENPPHSSAFDVRDPERIRSRGSELSAAAGIDSRGHESTTPAKRP